MKRVSDVIVAGVQICFALLLVEGSASAQDDPGDLPPEPVECAITYGPRVGPTGHLYEVVLGCDWSWNEANVEASLRSIGGATGHLATITSAVEDDFIEKLRQDALVSVGIDPVDPATAPQLWVGGFQAPNQEEINQGWSWVNGEGPIPETNSDPGYAHWLPGEPNDALATYLIEDNEENYLTIGIFGQYGWNDEGANLGGYVVEYEAVVLPEISIRIEPVRPFRILPERRFAMRRITAIHADQNEDEDEDPPQIFVFGSGQNEPLGPYRSGAIFVFDLAGRLEPRETNQFVVIPVHDLPTIVARHGGHTSQPLVPDIRLPRGIEPAETCGPTIPKEELRNLARIVPGAWSPGIWNTNALAIQTFVMGFTNGDHHLGAFELTPIQAPGDTCHTSHSLYLSDRDYGPFGLEGDDPVQYVVSFCDLQGIGEVLSTGTFVARGRRNLPLPRTIRADEVVVLAGFSFRTRGSNHQIREIAVMPDPVNSVVEVFYGDDDGRDFYDVSVDVIVAHRSFFAQDASGTPFRGVLIDAPSNGAQGFGVFPVGAPPTASEEPLLAGFRFRYRGSDQNLERIGVILNPATPTRAGMGSALFWEDGRDVPFTAEVRWAGLLSRP